MSCLVCGTEIRKGHHRCRECRQALKEQMVYDYMDGMSFAAISRKHGLHPQKARTMLVQEWDTGHQGLFEMMGMDVSNHVSTRRTIHDHWGSPRQRIEEILVRCRRRAGISLQQEEDRKFLEEERRSGGIIPISRGRLHGS